ncbi:lytic murein transglycosylase [Streptomyces sp. WI04-05B]|uniref:lytic murein transglycosylase n=1 Tax=Streptomyces TaxID=1883 RepID=UPI0029B27951|nr:MULTISPECIES: lytic murein transglycosylase [unclassified Streptomyces]MDX2541247.1 lytic murein transglycosylase [Streptomyces sp. WI04-05B]MDX2585523.1 lytic murein transglycosylase [Streptomyces sp. WI04-05A]MDX3751337.1 lytic murein transglycosylase [Streptomyces sp. AK08-02]
MAAYIGRRLRKGAATTAVAALAVAALSASQAPGATVDDQGRRTASDSQPTSETTTDDSASATGNSPPYYTDLPPLRSPNPSPSPAQSSVIGTPVSIGEAEAGIPATVLDAYKKAETVLATAKPGCNLPWQLLAAIGKVESGQARGGRVDANGTTTSPILGPQLDGNGFALIKDTDNGAYDGNSSYDSAVGPMQFIPSTWAWAGRDGNGDGRKDPNNVYDAALAAGHYLCRFGWDLSTQADLNRAILSYNNSTEYLNLVLSWLEYYRKGIHEVPDGTGTLPAGNGDHNSGASPTPSPGGTTPSPGPSTPGTSTPAPAKPGKPTVPTPTPVPTPAPTPTDTVDHLEDAGTAKLTAMAGDAFTKRISTRAETSAGKAVGKVRIRFTIVGDTDTTFTGGESVATVVTGSTGVAVAPSLKAGEKTGDFTVRAIVVGRTVTGVDYTATVTARAADTLARTATTALTCVAGGEFADQVEVKATYDGALADNVAATATLVTSADDATVNAKGPYFKDADGKTVRTLTGLKTDANGLLKLPKLYADDTVGTFLLRITTTGGATLTVELTVTAAPTPTESAGSTAPTESADPSASASPSA